MQSIRPVLNKVSVLFGNGVKQVVLLSPQVLWDHPYITSAKGLGCWGQFLLTFSIINADVGWVDGSEKVQKCADVI